MVKKTTKKKSATKKAISGRTTKKATSSTVSVSALKKKAKAEFARARKRLDKAEKDVHAFVEKHPGRAAAVVGGIGVAVGAAIGAAIAGRKRKK